MAQAGLRSAEGLTLCVQDILRGRRLERIVTPGDWAHTILAALTHDIG
jgi:hypothetical protein